MAQQQPQQPVDHHREPCPDRILDDVGGAFGMGAIGGGLFHAGKQMIWGPKNFKLRGAVEVRAEQVACGRGVCARVMQERSRRQDDASKTHRTVESFRGHVCCTSACWSHVACDIERGALPNALVVAGRYRALYTQAARCQQGRFACRAVSTIPAVACGCRLRCRCRKEGMRVTSSPGQ